MTSLFEAAGMESGAPTPLAERLRPQSLEDVIGQDHVVGGEAPLGRMLKEGRLASLILWGPPGTGKTTIARLLAGHVGLQFEQISAIFSGVADLRKVFAAAKARRLAGQGTLLFVDEIHRFNRAQQDGFLPHMEDGTITLVGATTENPSFELNPAVLSRAQVLVLNRLDAQDLNKLLVRAEALEERRLPLTEEAREALCMLADGDGRYLLNLAEELFAMAAGEALDVAALGRVLQRRAPVYDKGQESHYNLVSALHKCVRGSDPDAALYYLARMLEGGEDPLFIARRLVRMAVEDIGLADPQALVQANAAKEAYQFLGSPEGDLALYQAVVYLATAPKSNKVYMAAKAAQKAAGAHGSISPPMTILNAPTGLMDELGYGEGYIYDHDTPEGFSGQNYFPQEFSRRPQFYAPSERGFEKDIAKRLVYWQKLRARKTSPSGEEG
ncbi:MAG: replication-associated recombination protein A [Alphaproteobacteria bacterium]|nr:MAG: replication-associated recombination protein A [Alphaproteobacteria bacterium]